MEEWEREWVEVGDGASGSGIQRWGGKGIFCIFMY